MGEQLRQAADLEHWPAFRASFDRLAALVERAANSGPATVSILSGDVHHSYAARAERARRRRRAPAHLLARAQRHGLVRQARLPARVVAPARGR